MTRSAWKPISTVPTERGQVLLEIQAKADFSAYLDDLLAQKRNGLENETGRYPVLDRMIERRLDSYKEKIPKLANDGPPTEVLQVLYERAIRR